METLPTHEETKKKYNHVESRVKSVRNTEDLERLAINPKKHFKNIDHQEEERKNDIDYKVRDYAKKLNPIKREKYKISDQNIRSVYSIYLKSEKDRKEGKLEEANQKEDEETIRDKIIENFKTLDSQYKETYNHKSTIRHVSKEMDAEKILDIIQE